MKFIFAKVFNLIFSIIFLINLIKIVNIFLLTNYTL